MGPIKFGEGLEMSPYLENTIYGSCALNPKKKKKVLEAKGVGR